MVTGEAGTERCSAVFLVCVHCSWVCISYFVGANLLFFLCFFFVVFFLFFFRRIMENLSCGHTFGFSPFLSDPLKSGITVMIVLPVHKLQ